ncbi:MAG: chromosomal replication initiator protein DnaA [Dehalococcoidia bacterium]|jgi:chromosomal replication initiator protein|nr:chromosomal replication initiator protein DnaA [Dehalococcoidia bacterium]MDW8009900.1 chromosomal replication initiator protein DnaA [Chloroflexota bacterium]
MSSEEAARRLWETVLGQLQLQVTRPNYDTYLRDTVGLELTADRLVVGAPNDYAAAWLSSRALPLITSTVTRVLGRRVEVTFRLHQPAPRQGNGTQSLLRPTPLPASDPNAGRLNSRYTFDRFVVGENTRLAYAAALAVADSPGELYNPLYIFSGPGLGKTHLLQAIAHRLISQGRRVLYVTAEQFTSDFVTALGQRRVDDFRARYYQLDALLVDDVHLLTGKERTQEEFYHTFNHVYLQRGQIVLAADRPPHDLLGLDSHLRSRFEGGLVVDIQPPSLETRLAIVQRKAQELRFPLPDDIARYLAELCTRSVRELEGYLNRVVAYARLIEAPAIDLEVVDKALAALSRSNPIQPPSPETVIRTVAQFFNVPPNALAGKGRSKLLADARHIAMYLLREQCQLSLKDIGRLFGNRDHSTVIHALSKIESLLRTDPLLRRQVAEIRSLLSLGLSQATA